MAKAKDNSITTTITLQTPIERGSETITTISVRRPGAGELRGVQLMTLMAGDVDGVAKVAPRITTPALQPNELQAMDPADFFAIAQEITGFLLPNSIQAS